MGFAQIIRIGGVVVIAFLLTLCSIQYSTLSDLRATNAELNGEVQNLQSTIVFLNAEALKDEKAIRALTRKVSKAYQNAGQFSSQLGGLNEDNKKFLLIPVPSDTKRVLDQSRNEAVQAELEPGRDSPDTGVVTGANK